MATETNSATKDDDDAESSVPGGKNYITPDGHERLKAERRQLWTVDRPEVVRVVEWAAGNGDRSENGDYIYGKKRLREIDRRLRFLDKRLAAAVPVDPTQQTRRDQVFFGATVTYANENGDERTITIKGIDEADSLHGEISWVAPIARVLLKARVGDELQLMTPGGLEEIEVVEVRYPESTP